MSEAEDVESNVEGEVCEVDEAPTAFAKVMANILSANTDAKSKKRTILSKVGETKRLKRSDEEKHVLRLKREAKRKRQLERNAWEKMSMVKPSIEEKDKERSLAKVATKGVVQLFNAVSSQQDRLRSTLGEEGTTDLKRKRIVDGLSRSSFINLLKSQSNVKAEQEEPAQAKRGSLPKREAKSEKQPKWKSLHDDFALSEFASGLSANQDDSEQVKSETYE